MKKNPQYLNLILTIFCVMLCVILSITSYIKLSDVKKTEGVNLYTLIPLSASVIVDTDNVSDLIREINALNFTNDTRSLHISRLFSNLKQYCDTLIEEIPHGLSKQMNKALVSFHEPDNSKNQVFYCRLGPPADYKLVERFIFKYCGVSFPSKTFRYKGEKIHIYPMPDGDFLACCVTSGFLVVSYQKKLIEEAIDAYRDQKSILTDKAFARIFEKEKSNIPLTIYARMNLSAPDNDTDNHLCEREWIEFDMKTADNAIYFSGIHYKTDTCFTVIDLQHGQKSITGFPGNKLPASTFFFTEQATTYNLQSIFEFTTRRKSNEAIYPDITEEREQAIIRFLNHNAGDCSTACLFLSPDTARAGTCAVLNIPMRNISKAESEYNDLLKDITGNQLLKPSSKQITVWPQTTLFTFLPNEKITEPTLDMYTCFYKESLLIAPDAESLTSYIDYLDKNETLEKESLYEECMSNHLHTYHFMMVADMQELFDRSDNYVQLLPDFFFRNREFFSRFIFTAQLTHSEHSGATYFNLVLLHKGD